jgi:hypothetical protein
LAARFGLGGTATFWAIPLLGFALFALLAWFALTWIRARYRAKLMNEQSLSGDAVLLIFAVVNSVDLVFEGWAWIFSGLAAFAAYKLAVRIGFSIVRRRAAAPDNARLLVLRVFSLGRRSERLFAQLSGYWRQMLLRLTPVCFVDTMGHGATGVSERHAGVPRTFLHTAGLPRIPGPEPMA